MSKQETTAKTFSTTTPSNHISVNKCLLMNAAGSALGNLSGIAEKVGFTREEWFAIRKYVLTQIEEKQK